jgi:hypothetical protein
MGASMLRMTVLVLTTIALLGLDAVAQTKPAWVRPKLVGAASDSGHFSLDEAKLKALFPDFPWEPEQLAYLNEHLDLGDSRAAIVASVKPLVVSCYSDELDGVILVQFPDALVEKDGLKVGDRLIASWVYPNLRQPPADVALGEKNLKRYNNGKPIVADFFSSSDDRLKRRKAGVAKAEWDRVAELTPPAMKRADGKYRSANPLDVWRPAK